MREGEIAQPTVLVEGWALLQLDGDLVGYALQNEHINAVGGAVPYTAIAVTEASVREASPTKAAAAQIIQRMVRQIRRNTALACFERTLDFLLEMHERKGIAVGEEFEMPLPQETLAAMMGMSAVHLNRVLQRMTAQRYLRRDRKIWRLLQASPLDASSRL